jgi:hypothetical protein
LEWPSSGGNKADGVTLSPAEAQRATPICITCDEGWDNACADPAHRIVRIATGAGNAGTGWFSTATEVL